MYPSYYEITLAK